MNVSKNEMPVGVGIMFLEMPNASQMNTHHNCFTIYVKIHHTMMQPGTQIDD
jgi:hypothetical protein